METPSTSDTRIQQQTVVQDTHQAENKDEEQFYPAADSTGGETEREEFKEHNNTFRSPTPIRSPRLSPSLQQKKLKRSATTISPTTVDGNPPRPASAEEKIIRTLDTAKGEISRHDSPLIIEVKKPPSPEAAWENISQVIVNKSTEPAENFVGDNKNNELPPPKDTSPLTDASNTKVRDSPCARESKIIKSSIPRFTKNKSKVISHPAEKNEKKHFPVFMRVNKACTPSRPVQTVLNQSRKIGNAASRSRASSMSSSHPSSPVSVPPSAANNRAKSPSSSMAYRGNKEKELHNMLEEMCSTIGQMKEGEDANNAVACDLPRFPESRPGDKRSIKLDYIMPAKDGAGETFSRSKTLQTEAAKREEVVKNITLDFDLLARKTDVLQRLSELNGQNQLNLKALHDIIKQIIKSNDDTYSQQLEIQFYNLEQTQIELVQRLVRTVTKFYDERENLREENDKFREKQEKLIPEIEERLGKLESENTDLSERLKITTQNLEEERMISQKKKIASQSFAQTKSKVQKAESRLQHLEIRTSELTAWSKKLETVIKQKEFVFEQNAKKIKLAETTISELELENRNLKEEIEFVKKTEQERLTNIINDSQELKEAKTQLISLHEQLREEIDRREQTSHKLQETTTRLKSMEDKCKNLTSLVDSAKNEVKMKQMESADKEKKLKEEIDQLRTELQARKVMLKVAEDEVVLTKNKLDKAEIQARQEQKKEREVSSIEEQLRLDLAIRDEQITQLQEQIKGLIEKKFNNREPPKSKNRFSDKLTGSSFNERVALTAQVVDLERTIDTLAKDNLQLNQLLNQKNLELDQRDRIVKMQTEVLKIRDELIFLLKSKEAKHEEDIKRLNDIIQERENAIAKEWNRAIEDNWQTNGAKSWQKIERSSSQDTSINPTEESMYLSGTMYELYSSLEKKQMELEVMQQRVQQLEGMQEAYNQQRTRQEARISQLEMALSEKCLDTSGLVPILAQ